MFPLAQLTLREAVFFGAGNHKWNHSELAGHSSYYNVCLVWRQIVYAVFLLLNGTCDVSFSKDYVLLLETSTKRVVVCYQRFISLQILRPSCVPLKEGVFVVSPLHWDIKNNLSFGSSTNLELDSSSRLKIISGNANPCLARVLHHVIFCLY